MEYKINIFFTNSKDLNIVLEESDLKEFLKNLQEDGAYWNKDGASGFGVPKYNIMYYAFNEYTAEMRATDEAKVAAALQDKIEKEEAILKAEEENKKAK